MMLLCSASKASSRAGRRLRRPHAVTTTRFESLLRACPRALARAAPVQASSAPRCRRRRCSASRWSPRSDSIGRRSARRSSVGALCSLRRSRPFVWGACAARPHAGRSRASRGSSRSARRRSTIDWSTRWTSSRSDRSRLAQRSLEPMLADAARRADAVDLDDDRAGRLAAARRIPGGRRPRAARRPSSRRAQPARQAFDAASLALFPRRVTLEVTPGNARVKAGTPLAIEARLVGNRAPGVGARRDRRRRPRWRAARDGGRRTARSTWRCRPVSDVVHVSRGRRHGDVSRLHGHGRARASRDARSTSTTRIRRRSA